MSFLGRLLRSTRASQPTARPSLYDIFLRNTWKDIHKWHHYFDIYERFLSPLRDRPLKMLEVGVYKGGSLRMWTEYFGPSATLYGMDIVPEAVDRAPPNVRVFIGDQADRNFLRSVVEQVGELDVVIDDGGHKMSQQIATFEELYPITKQLFIVEDTHTCYWDQFKDLGTLTFLDYARAKVDVLHEWHHELMSFARHEQPPAEREGPDDVSEFCATTRGIHFFDSMVVFEKGENPPRWLELR